jgi:hypothetical protein
VQFLSPEWVDALDAAARSRPGRAAASRPPVRLIVQQTVRDTAWGDVTYAVEMSDDGVAVHAGPVDDPTVTLTTDLRTAAAIARGELAAQLAFMEGRLRIGGDVRALLTHGPGIAELGDHFATVRERTEWPDAAASGQLTE